MSQKLHETVVNRVHELGITFEEGSKRSGLDKTYIRKMLERPGSSPRADTLAKLAAGLNLPVRVLLEVHTAEDGSEMLTPNEHRRLHADIKPSNVSPPSIRDMPNDLPVLGTAAGSHLGGAFQLDEASVVDYVRRPPSLLGAKGIYGIYVEGDSMVPEHNPGDLRIVHPGRTPRIGDSVVVQMQFGDNEPIEAMLGRYVRKTAKVLVLGKHNPPREIELAADTIKSFHKVLPMHELFGV